MDEYFHFLICLLEQNKFFMKDGTVHFLRNACVDVEDVDMRRPAQCQCRVEWRPVRRRPCRGRVSRDKPVIGYNSDTTNCICVCYDFQSHSVAKCRCFELPPVWSSYEYDTWYFPQTLTRKTKQAKMCVNVIVIPRVWRAFQCCHAIAELGIWNCK